jgi:hypothetical protein
VPECKSARKKKTSLNLNFLERMEMKRKEKSQSWILRMGTEEVRF